MYQTSKPHHTEALNKEQISKEGSYSKHDNVYSRPRSAPAPGAV